MTDLRPDDAIDLAEAMTQLWQGHNSATIGAALAQALALFLASHPEDEREWVIDMHIAAVRRMVPIILKERGLPDE